MPFVLPARPGRARVMILAAFGALLPAAGAVAADPPSPDLALTFRPVQKGVDIDAPPKAEWPQCSVKVERKGKVSGWVVYGPQGQVLRRFLDTDGDNVVDQWRYYKNGLEVYRDLDSNANNKVDQFRWLNAGGTRWGLDPDEDGVVNSWKVLSAEEASRVAVESLLKGDVGAMQTVLVTADDLKKLGVGAEMTKPLLDAVADPAGKVRQAADGSKMLGRGTTWLRFDSSSPGVVPADDGKADRDLYVYENAMAIVDVSGTPGLIQIGEMVRVGEVWKLTQVPKPIEGDSVQISAGGVLMQPQMVLPDAAVAGISPQMRSLLEELQKLDAAAPDPAGGPEAFTRYNARRAEILAGLVKASDNADEQEQWTRQLADSVSAAVQTGVYPEGMARLEALEKELTAAKAPAALQGYVTYRRLVADYSSRLRSADNQGRVEVQKWWLEQLKSFAETYPSSTEAADALLQLAVSEEFAGNVDEATAWYKKLAKAHPDTDPGRRAAGALYRLGLKGQPLRLSVAGLKGGKVTHDDFRGKVLLVLFWSTWCKPCSEDLPAIRELYEKYKGQGFEIVGVNLDQTAEPVPSYLAQNKMSWPQAHEPGGLESKPALDFGIISLPTMILVGKDGMVVSRGVGVEDLKASLPDLLNGK